MGHFYEDTLLEETPQQKPTPQAGGIRGTSLRFDVFQ